MDEMTEKVETAAQLAGLLNTSMPTAVLDAAIAGEYDALKARPALEQPAPERIRVHFAGRVEALVKKQADEVATAESVVAAVGAELAQAEARAIVPRSHVDLLHQQHEGREIGLQHRQNAQLLDMMEEQLNDNRLPRLGMTGVLAEYRSLLATNADGRHDPRLRVIEQAIADGLPTVRRGRGRSETDHADATALMALQRAVAEARAARLKAAGLEGLRPKVEAAAATVRKWRNLQTTRPRPTFDAVMTRVSAARERTSALGAII